MTLNENGAVYYTSMESPLGDLWLAKTERGLCRLDFGLDEAEWVGLLERERISAPRRDASQLADATIQLEEYFEGRRRSFDLPLDLSGTTFQRQVWMAAVNIPYGQVRSYGEIALTIEAPRAMRAVGGALAKNPVPIVVPCHRVVRADGTLGGFSGGLGIKKALLAIEGHAQFR